MKTRFVAGVMLVALGYAWCRRPPPERGDWGAPCERDEQCGHGLVCGRSYGERFAYCTQVCGRDDECPHGWECEPILDPRDGVCRRP